MTSISTLGQALDNMERLSNLQTQIATVQAQISTGHKANLFDGLGSGVVDDQRARGNFDSLTTYINNITIADRRIGVMSNSIGEIQAQAQNVIGALTVNPSEGADLDISTISKEASSAQQFINDDINAKDGNRYVFSGADTLTPPLTDNGSLDTYEQTQLAKWVNGTITTAQLIQSYRDPKQLTDTTIGYSPTLASGNAKGVAVKTDDNTETDYTVLGNTDAIRNIVVATSMVKNLSVAIDKITSDPSDPPGTKTAPGPDANTQKANFYQLFNDLTSMINDSKNALDTSSTDLAQTDAQIKQVSADHQTDQATLQGTIGDIENADMNQAAVQVNALQTQLQASYAVTANLGKLSLVNFLQ